MLFVTVNVPPASGPVNEVEPVYVLGSKSKMKT